MSDIPPASSFPSDLPAGIFATTRWTLVVAAGSGTTVQSARALEELCRAYWYPLYAYTRRRGYAREDAEDLTQGFFERFLRKNYLEDLSAARGSFRGYLLASLKHYIANERGRAGRIKRGGEVIRLALDWQEADGRFEIADVTRLPPDAAYDREWAVALLARVIAMLKDEFVAEGKGDRFDELKAYLSVEKDHIRYSAAALALEMDEGAVRVAVHRLRKRYRVLLKEEVARTLADPSMVEEELKALMAAFA